ncbi:MAG: hypothetical protein ACFHXK_08160 [bacterium]
MKKARLLSPGVLAFCLFLVCVNVLSGYMAITFNYPSLFNVQASFGEYAYPVPFTWALAHWPSMLIYGVPLLYLKRNRGKLIQYYRLFCAVTFGLLLVVFNAKIPFALFATVDAITGLIFSLILVPPNLKDNPVLFPLTCISAGVGFAVVVFVAYGQWQHRTPALKTTVYAEGIYELSRFDVRKNVREMRIVMDLKQRLDIQKSCELGRQVATKVLQDYPFDSGYNRLLEVWFSPADRNIPENNGAPYPLGEISLNDADRDADGRYACYMSYKRQQA